MPLWLIYHPPNTFTTPTAKQALSASITKIYTDVGLPAFYVVVNFITLDPTNTWIGGVHQLDTSSDSNRRDKPFIRLSIDQIAIRNPNEDAAYARNTRSIDEALKPHIADMGYDWEYSVDETERRLWKINGFAPPPWKSEGEAVWRKENKPVKL